MKINYVFKLYIKAFALILMQTIAVFAFADNVKVQREHITTLNGLANNSIRYIHQDSKGFLWMSTLNGISRYDGYTFVNFMMQHGDEAALANNRPNQIIEDKNGFLWITSFSNQISCYDLKHDRFVDFTGNGGHKEKYGRVTLSDNGDVWLWGQSKGALRVYYDGTQLKSELFDAETDLKTDEILFVSSADGYVIICTDNGLFAWKDGKLQVLDKEHEYICAHPFGEYVGVIAVDGKTYKATDTTLSYLGQIPGVSSKNHITGELNIGQKWLIFTRKGSFVADMDKSSLAEAPQQWTIPNGFVVVDNRGDYWIHDRTGTLRYITKEGHKVREFSLMTPAQASLVTTERYFITHDSHGLIWIGTYGNGVFLYNPETDVLKQYLAEDEYPIISGNTIQYLMEDRSGSIWICSEYGGINHLKVLNEGASYLYPTPLSTATMNSNDVRLIAKKSDGDIVISTRDGKVTTYNGKLNTQKGQETYNKNLYALLYDNQGRQCVGTRGEGIFIDGKQYRHEADNSSSLAANEIFCMLNDKKGRLWIGTFGGGLDLMVKDGQFQHFLNEEYGEKRIQCMTMDTYGRIWAGTSSGIYVFYPDSLIASPKAYAKFCMENGALNSNEIRVITMDRSGNIWAGETGTGFALFKADKIANLWECTPETGAIQHFSTKDGLVNDMVQGILDVSPQQLWITTEYGVSCFNPLTQHFENYFFSDNMMGNTFSQGSTYLLDDGRLALGTKEGVTIVSPDKMKHASNTPTVTFTTLYINGSPTTQDSDINDAVAYSKEITLNHEQNNISIYFSTFNYSNTSPQNYIYYLEGYDEGWSEPSTSPFVAFKKLPHGKYVLHVKAQNANGSWDVEESTVDIIITPPWWKTTWAYIIYAILIIAIIYGAIRVFLHTEELRNRIKMEKQMTDFKLTFFTNISHEFRTPLTLISGALERMRLKERQDGQGALSNNVSDSIQIMEKSTRRMMRLINQILEFRKVQKGKSTLSLREVDIIAFAKEIYESFTDSAAAKNITFVIRTSHTSYMMYADTDKLDKILYNLLSNAFKYSLANAKVTMTVDVLTASKQLVIKVIDTGIGIPADKREQIFERFAHGQFGLDSMGIGLNLTAELVHIHHGMIEYSENPEGGSILTVSIPSDRACYKPEDYVAQVDAENIDTPNKTEVVKSADGQEISEQISTEAGPLNNRNILIIEDDDDIRNFLKQSISPYFHVETAPDGISGYEFAANNPLDLIVCDVLMPGMNGFEVTNKLKTNFETSHIPVILLTALSATDKQVEGIKSGADAYITKPFSIEVLINRIIQLIDQRNRLREKFSTDLSQLAPVVVSNDDDKKFVDDLTKIIEDNLSDEKISVDDLAAKMGVGRTIFFRKVKGLTGYAPKEYLRTIRMKKAAELLRHPDLSISDVAYSVGFSDSLYFSKCFKAQFNQSPSNYRKEAIPPE